MDNVSLVEVVHCTQDLFDCLRSILFGELSVLADAIKELPPSGQFRNDVVFVLWSVSANAKSINGYSRTLDSNQSWNRTMFGWLSF